MVKIIQQDVVDAAKATFLLYITEKRTVTANYDPKNAVPNLNAILQDTMQEAVGFDIGRPLMVVNCAQLIDKYVGESAKNIEKVFEEAKAQATRCRCHRLHHHLRLHHCHLHLSPPPPSPLQEAVLVFDESEGLFASRSNDGGSTSRHDSMNVGVLLHHMETFSGIVVAITNRFVQIDTAFHRRFKFILEFPMPDAATRAKLWRQLIPKEAPLAADVDLAALGDGYELSGGSIKSAVFRAAVEASLQPEEAKRVISMEVLHAAAKEEVEKGGDGKRPQGMYT